LNSLRAISDAPNVKFDSIIRTPLAAFNWEREGSCIRR
jgi:hypothetical protein